MDQFLGGRSLDEPALPERFEDRLGSQLDDRTRLVLFSHVLYSCAVTIVPGPIVDRARSEYPRAIVAIDGAHALGQIPIDVHSYGCDAYVTSGSKWLNAPAGTGVLYVSDRCRNRFPDLLWPLETYDGSPGMARARATGTVEYPEASDRDVVLGVTPQLPLIGFSAALHEYTEMGSVSVCKRISTQALAAQQLLLAGLPERVSCNLNRDTGMLFLRFPEIEYELLTAIVSDMRMRRIHVQAIRYPIGLRVSVHYFTVENDILDLIQELFRQGVA